MNIKFLKFSQSEITNANQVCKNYLGSKINDNEYNLVMSLLENTIQDRTNISFDETLSTIENAIKGYVINDGLLDINGKPQTIPSGEAMTIINNKASIFDVNNLKVELKATTSLTDENIEEEVIDSNGDTVIQYDSRTYADLFNGILNGNYLSKPSFKFCVADAIRYSRGYPMAISMIGWDDNTLVGNDDNQLGDITFSNIPIQDFYWDPSSTSMDTCEYVAIKKVLSYDNVKAFISNIKDGDVELLQSAYITMVSNYVSDSISANNNKNITNQISNGAIELFTLYMKQRVNNKLQIKLYHIVNKQFIVATQVYDIPYLPFAILKETSAPNVFWGVSSVMIALPKIQQKALIDAAITTSILANKDDIVVYDSQSINSNDLMNPTLSINGKNYVGTNGNVSSVIYNVPKSYVSNDTIAYLNMIDSEINKLTSSTDITQVGSKLSGSAVQNVLNQATIQENNSVIELEKYLVRLIQILMAFIRVKLTSKKDKELTFNYTPSTDGDIMKQDGKATIKITSDMIERFNGEVIIDASLLRTSKQLKQQQDLMALYQLQAQYFGKSDIITLVDIAKELNLPNKNAMIERLAQQDASVKLQQATQLVNGVLQLLQDPNIQQQFPNLTVEQAIQLLLAQQQGGK